MNFLEEKKLKIIFKEVISGKTKVYDNLAKQQLYIKHYGDYSSVDLDEYYLNFYQKAIAEGLPTEKEKIQFLISEDLWSDKDDEKIKYYADKLNTLKDLKSKTYLLSQLDKLKKEISEISVELNTLKAKKIELLGYTAEKHTESKVEYYYILNSYFLDENLTDKRFKEDDNDIETFGQYNFYIKLHNLAISKYNIKNIKKVAVSYYMQSLLSLSKENAYYFFGKPVYSLTYYQSSLYSYGLFYDKISSSPEYSKVSQEVKDDPDKLIEYYSATSNLKRKVENNKDVKGPVFVMDATEKDLDFLNQNKTKHNQNSLDDLAKKQGGALNLEDLAKFYNKK